MHDVEFYAREITHRHVTELSIAIDGAGRKAHESDVSVDRVTVRARARATRHYPQS